MKKDYQLCNRCVMDNASDETITFDENGFCNYCTTALQSMKYVYFPNEEGEKKLTSLISKLKEEGKGRKYDCIMGISGGLDSSYLAYLGYKWGLRILAVHIDDGFDTEVSKRNIDKLTKATDIDLMIDKPDPIQYHGLTRAFMMAGVPNIAIPQDNLIFASLHKYAKKHKVKNFLSGGNFALESILQAGNTFTVYDMVHNKAINKRFGTTPINKLNMMSNYQRFFDGLFKKVNTPRPLNFINYNRDRALKELAEFCDFEYYGSKHLENLLTKFIQCYWFYHKFGVDKRRSHLSSMIVSDQINRSDALIELKKPMYDEEEMQQEISHICQMFEISPIEFTQIMDNTPRQHTDYPTINFDRVFSIPRKVKKIMNTLRIKK